MMKKLFLWSVLLMTGFAFYSCDDVIDNPAGGKQDPSNPNATWTYEVSIKFVDFSLWHNDGNGNWVNTDIDGEKVTYKAPSTVYVHNKAGEFLGELKAVEEFDYKNFKFDSYYKFAGTLTGAIGEELVISTLKDFDYYSKQDGTLKTLAENCMLATAEVPIIVADNNRKKIATQNVKLESAILAIFARFNNYADDTDRSFTLTADSLIATPSFEVKFAEDVKPQTEGFFFAFAPSAKESAKYNFEFNSEEKGIKGINVWESAYKGLTSVQSVWNLNFSIKEVDLTKYTKYLKDVEKQNAPYNIYIYANINDNIEPIIYQSGQDAVDVILTINGKATLKDINIGENGYLQTWGYHYYNEEYDYNYIANIKLEGANVIDTKQWAGVQAYRDINFVGNGSLTVTGPNAIVITDVTNRWGTKDNVYKDIYEPSVLTINEGVKIIAKGTFGQAITVNTAYYQEYGNEVKYIANVPNRLILNGGSLEATGAEGAPAISLSGKMLITPAATVIANAGKNGAFCIYDANTGEEAKIESLVEDPTKFDDTTAEGVRTIKKK